MFQLGCSEENKQGELIVQLGCDKIEVVSDIEYSVENLEDYFKTKNIRVIKKYDIKECGYILKYGDTEFKIGSALTDVDLKEKIDEAIEAR